MPETSDDASLPDLRFEEIVVQYLRQKEQGQGPDTDQFLRSYPERADRLREFFAGQALFDRLAPDLAPTLDTLRAGAGGAILGVKAPRAATALVPAAETQAAAGTTPAQTLGPFELLEVLGEGGMGKVWKARQRDLDRIVAVKVLSDHWLARPGAVARFRQEMQAIGRLDHPHIVRALHAETAALPYLAMEYVEGIDLAKLLHQRGPLPVPDACELVVQAARGLQHAHEAGLVHRDVKPSNLMLTNQGKVKLLDLGLARLRADDPEAGAVTGVGDVMGTPDYMAPEQRLDSHRVDIRADVYSLGCTLYELLAGRAPFAGPEHPHPNAKWAAHLHEAPRPLVERRPEVPAALSNVVEKLLAKDLAQRCATPAEVIAALQPFTTGHRLADLLPASLRGSAVVADTVATPAATVPQTTRPLHRRFLRTVALLGLALGVAAALWWLRAPAGTLRVVRFEVVPYRDVGSNTVALTVVGQTSPLSHVQRDDYLKVKVELSEPAYCYLLAFNANGSEQLCYPFKADRDQPPAALAGLTYPQGTTFFACDDGVGLQAFVLLASRRRLPAYAEWKARVGALPWQATPGAEGWRRVGQSFEPLSGLPRGTEAARRVPRSLTDLCRILQERGGCDVLEAVAFPVRPRDDQRP
jgi:serine/threonine protein kinase